MPVPKRTGLKAANTLLRCRVSKEGIRRVARGAADILSLVVFWQVLRTPAFGKSTSLRE